MKNLTVETPLAASHAAVGTEQAPSYIGWLQLAAEHIDHVIRRNHAFQKIPLVDYRQGQQIVFVEEFSKLLLFRVFAR